MIEYYNNCVRAQNNRQQKLQFVIKKYKIRMIFNFVTAPLSDNIIFIKKLYKFYFHGFVLLWTNTPHYLKNVFL